MAQSHIVRKFRESEKKIMIWNYGNVYRMIRKSKGISQNNICNGNLERSTLSKFESKNRVPSFDTMQYLLEQVNVSFNEFEYICNEYNNSERQEILVDFYSLVSNAQRTKIDMLIKRCERYLKNNNDYKINEINHILHIFLELNELNKLNFSDISMKLATIVWDRISLIDTWTYDDIRTINFIFYFLPLETIKSIVPKMLRSLEKYNKLKEISILRLSILTNFSTIFLENAMYTECKNILDYAHSFAENAKRYDYLGIIMVRKSICEQKSEEVTKWLEFLSMASEEEVVTELKKEISRHLVRGSSK